MATALATTLHDPEALLAEPFEAAASALARVFAGVAVSLTEATDPRMERVLIDSLGARIVRHPTGEEFIGRGRRDAVGLALDVGAERVLYADPDHILHWLRTAPAELAQFSKSSPGLGSSSLAARRGPSLPCRTGCSRRRGRSTEPMS